jgi:hypothetical protein
MTLSGFWDRLLSAISARRARRGQQRPAAKAWDAPMASRFGLCYNPLRPGAALGAKIFLRGEESAQNRCYSR